MDEFEFINKLKKKPEKDILSIGDDAAYAEGLLIAKDLLVENVHFLPSTPIKFVIKKLFVSNISDICAMGGYPEYCLLGISIPSGYAYMDELISSINEMTEKYNICLIGGDTTSSLSGLFLSLTVIGKSYKDVLKRSGAKPGDLVYLSRPVGLSRLSLEKELGVREWNINPYLHYNNEPEIELGRLLGNSGMVTSCIDISDGLGRDALHIAEMSKVKIIIHEDMLDTSIFNDFDLSDKVKYAISSGEEFALMFTVNSEMKEKFSHLIYQFKDRVREIGVVAEGSGVFLKSRNMFIDISKWGFEHIL
jgi:thiamine-monophosphate kinase